MKTGGQNVGWTGSGGGGGSSEIESVGTGETLVVAPNKVKSLLAGSGISVTADELGNLVITSTGEAITVVANWDALPDPTTVSGDFYWCSASQGTAWLWGSLGGTFYDSGLYYSNGVSWEYMKVPYQATQATVNAGLVTDQFVSPATLNNSGYITQAAAKISATASGTNTYTATLTPAITSYASTLKVYINFTNTNTVTNPTLALNGLAALGFVNADGTTIALGALKGIVQLAYNGSAWQVLGGLPEVDLNGSTIDGQGGVVQAGTQSTFQASFSGFITGWTLVECSKPPIAGTVVIDAWKDTLANYPPTVADTMFGGGGKPSLTAEIKNSATGLAIPVTEGDIVILNIDSNLLGTKYILTFKMVRA